MFQLTRVVKCLMELTHEYRDKDGYENSADSDDIYILLKWGGIINCYEG